MSDKDLEEFEACVLPFLIDNGVDTCLALKKNNCGNYELKSIQSRWEGWQASAKHYQSRIAELEAEVVRLKELINNLGHGAGCRCLSAHGH